MKKHLVMSYLVTKCDIQRYTCVSTLKNSSDNVNFEITQSFTTEERVGFSKFFPILIFEKQNMIVKIQRIAIFGFNFQLSETVMGKVIPINLTLDFNGSPRFFQQSVFIRTGISEKFLLVRRRFVKLEDIRKSMSPYCNGLHGIDDQN